MCVNEGLSSIFTCLRVRLMSCTCWACIPTHSGMCKVRGYRLRCADAGYKEPKCVRKVHKDPWVAASGA